MAENTFSTFQMDHRKASALVRTLDDADWDTDLPNFAAFADLLIPRQTQREPRSLSGEQDPFTSA